MVAAYAYSSMMVLFPVVWLDEIVHWDENDESVCKKKLLHIYEEEKGWGFGKLIALSELTAAASPYMKDGHVTFVVTFRVLPME